MAITQTGLSQTLPNGNWVSVTVGPTWHGAFRTVHVRRPDGSSRTVTSRRGLIGCLLLGGYRQSIPLWARR